MTRRTFVLLFTLAAVLRVLWINVPPLWYDENFTLILAKLPFEKMMQATMGDVHPPLWYLIEWGIYHITPGAPAWVIRVPALIFSLASLPLFVMMMRQIGISSQVQSAALFLMAVMPFQLWYAQEGRMYAMLEFFVLLALWAGLTRQNVLLFIGSVGLLYTQNYGPFYLAAIALVIFFRDRSVSFNWSMAAMVSAGVCWLPWLYVIVGQMQGINDRYWIVSKSAASLLIILYKLFLTAAVPSAFFFASYIVTFAALIIGIVSFVRSHHPGRLTIAIMAFAPLLIAWIVSMVWQPVLLFRPLIGSSPFLYLVTCWSIGENNVAVS